MSETASRHDTGASPGRRQAGARSDQALSRRAYATLRDQILHFERKPFAPISEQALAEELGVSRTPVREALARLSELGFVDIVPQSGSRIAPLRLFDLEKSQFLREALELALLARAMERGDRAELVRRLRTELAIQHKAGDHSFRRDALSRLSLLVHLK